MSQTSSGLLPAYLIVGADELKRRSSVARLKRRLNADFAAFNLDEHTASSDLEAGSLIASLNTLPMGDTFRLVIVDRVDKLPKPVSEALVTYLADPNTSCVLCLVSESLAKNTRLYKAVAKVGKQAIVDCTPKKRWELPPIVAKMAQTYGVRIDQDAAGELVSRVGESTTMLDAQLKVLAEICRERGVITLADVEGNVARVAEVKPWDLLDAVSARDAGKALALYRLMQSPSHVTLCSLVTGRVRELVCAKALEARGEGSLLAQELNKQAWQVKGYPGWARRFAPGELERGLVSCARCERALKSGADPDVTFTKLILELCGAVTPANESSFKA